MPGPTSPSAGDIVDGYWKQYRLSQSADRAERLAADDWWWAWEAVQAAVDLGDPSVVDLLVSLADAVADDEAALAYLGAGPIEDLLRHRKHGHLHDPVDDAARTNRSFQLALRCMWWGDEDDPDVVARFARFGPPL